jgi:hypothetical protein
MIFDHILDAIHKRNSRNDDHAWRHEAQCSHVAQVQEHSDPGDESARKGGGKRNEKEVSPAPAHFLAQPCACRFRYQRHKKGRPITTE